MQGYELYEVIFLLTDQLATCPFCGSRTDILLDLGHTTRNAQIHRCLSCQFEFATETDEDYLV
jgi:transposase-like protein